MMTRRALAVVGIILLLGLPSSGARAVGMSLGFNWTPGGAPMGETPQSALARIGGSVYRGYDNPFLGDVDRARIRLVRYGMAFQTPNALPGTTWQLGNEINLQEQDAAALTFEQAGAFASWYRTMRTQIKLADPAAVIIGPSVWNWDGAGSTCCVRGADAYAWFVQQHTALYGNVPQMDAIAVQVYPWSQSYWDDPQNAVPQGLAQIDGARAWSDGRWPVVVTEWGMLRKGFDCTLNAQQTQQERSLYTSGMLHGMQTRWVPFALYYGSHQQVPCDGNGLMSWLVEGDGTLTIEGHAHRGTVIVPLPTPLSQATAVRRRSPPTLMPTLTPLPIATSVASGTGR